MKTVRLGLLCACFAAVAAAQQSSITPEPLRTWLTSLASDELEGRATFSEGLGLAAAYIAEQLKEAGVRPAGDRESYFQRVEVLTIDLDADYQVVNTRYTRNVVGIVEGNDGRLKNTYVAFGVHYDHTGYSQGVLPNNQTDRINNGADAGEEQGLYGSRYFADHPTVPIDNIVTQLNLDMVGRNHNNLESESNTVYTVGADRISTELHNVLIDANESLAKPMTINFQLNDRTDSERIYYRSDHYSYAVKGIPMIFFTTFLHPDYHRPSDQAEKINFEKSARIGQLVYETGRQVANLDHAPVRDFKGPRVGKGGQGKILTSN